MRIQSLNVVDPTLNPLLNYQYTYNSVGNILTKTTEHGNYSYGYDDSSRLLTADHPVLDDESYTYDDVGNRLTDSSVSGSWSYNTNNELLGYADVEYEYDANGNLTEVRVAGQMVWTCVYDAANRLVHVEDGTGSISADYYYDPFGRRLWKDVGGVRTYFFYSEKGLIAEYDASGVEIRAYGYRPDSTWTTDPLWLKEGGSYYWYQNDHLGTPQKLTAQDGTVVWSAQYSAFGEADVQVETIVNNLRFPGQYADAETELHYNYFRYYDPGIGRYVSKDPIGFIGGDANWYTYARNNPAHFDDAFGLSHRSDITRKNDGKPDPELIYSCRCGWIDWSHATPSSVPRTLWSGEEIGPPQGEYVESNIADGFKVTDYQAMVAPFLKAMYGRSYFVPLSVKSLPRSEQEAIAFYIFREVREGFERTLQGDDLNGWNLNTIFAGDSSLSEEDLPSFLIGFYLKVKRRELLDYADHYELLPDSGRDARLKKAIEHICGVPQDIEKAIAISLNVWDANNGLGKNDQWKPRNHNSATGIAGDEICCPVSSPDPGTRYLEWPAELRTIPFITDPPIRPWIGMERYDGVDSILTDGGLLYLYWPDISLLIDLVPRLDLDF